jgi:hypothetical protein
MATMRPSPISGLAKCSKKPFLGISGFSRAAVKVLVAAALLLWTSSPVLAAVKVEGVPSWLEAPATRSMAAVWGEIDPRQEEETRLSVVKLVAARLFEGYSVGSAEMSGSDLHLVLKPINGAAWEVEGGGPSLPGPLSAWMDSDWQLARGRIADVISGLPLEALNWADAALRLEIAEILREHLPGWNGSLVVRLEEDRSILRVGLSPEQPVILAVMPRISSTSLPTLLHSDLKEDLLKGLSPLIGLPVAWVALHEKQVAEWAAGFMGEQSRVENLKIDGPNQTPAGYGPCGKAGKSQVHNLGMGGWLCRHFRPLSRGRGSSWPKSPVVPPLGC